MIYEVPFMECNLMYESYIEVVFRIRRSVSKGQYDETSLWVIVLLMGHKGWFHGWVRGSEIS